MRCSIATDCKKEQSTDVSSAQTDMGFSAILVKVPERFCLFMGFVFTDTDKLTLKFVWEGTGPIIAEKHSWERRVQWDHTLHPTATRTNTAWGYSMMRAAWVARSVGYPTLRVGYMGQWGDAWIQRQAHTWCPCWLWPDCKGSFKVQGRIKNEPQQGARLI